MLLESLLFRCFCSLSQSFADECFLFAAASPCTFFCRCISCQICARLISRTFMIHIPRIDMKHRIASNQISNILSFTTRIKTTFSINTAKQALALVS